ncbi:MAG: hypothetical protein J5779_02315 [Clostridia bacterium]|nr:hypothetical protein [Clostridia bacterium]
MSEEIKSDIQMYCPSKGKIVPVEEKEEEAKTAGTSQLEQADLVLDYIRARKDKLVRFKHGGHYHGSIHGIKTDKQKFVPRKIHSSFNKVREDIANRKTLG